jgi:hypothetical protein
MGLVILAINVMEQQHNVNAYIKKNKVPFKVLLDSDGKVSAAYGVRFFPTHFLINGKGEAVAYVPGGKDWDHKTSRNLIRHVIETNP